MSHHRVVLRCITLAIVCGLSAQAQQSTTAAASVEQQLPSVPGEVFSVTPDAGFHNEPSIAVNPVNPLQVFAAYQAHASVVYSQDGGDSWKTATGTASKDYKVSGDVGVTYDKHGTAILCYIAFDKLGTENYWARGATRNGVFIRRSPDGGATWEPTEHAVIAQPTQPGIPFEDKPGLFADNSSSPYAGNLYVGWTEFTLEETVIKFSRSADGGVTWAAPIVISTHHGLPRDDNGAVEGFSGAAAADGTIYAVWADGNSIALASSRDGGKTFEKSRSVIETAPLYFDMAGLDRANGFPQIAIDPRHGKMGRLYVTWSDYRAGDVGVYCASSDDGGKSWSKDVRVNSNAPHDGTDQFFQWLAVDPTTGAVNVIFYDRRGDADNRKTTVSLARSTDGGASFANYAWTRDTFIPTRNEFLGDYIGVAALSGKVYGVWAEIAPAETPKDQAAPPPTQFRPHTIVKVGVADFGKG
ncbi:MAG: sialidase family protein [Candidatus Korobacteraceae bacterium]